MFGSHRGGSKKLHTYYPTLRKNHPRVRGLRNGAYNLPSGHDIDIGKHLLHMNNTYTTQAPSEPYVLGLYEVGGLAIARFLDTAYKERRSIATSRTEWHHPNNWDPVAWSRQHCLNFVFATPRDGYGRLKEGEDEAMVTVTVTNAKIEIYLHASEHELDALLASITKDLQPAKTTVEWVYSGDGASISVPLASRPPINSAYPCLNGEKVTDYIERYLASDASVLILIGPPGTGKTSLIKNMIVQSGRSAKVTYDQQIIQNDRFFAGFIEGEERFMVMEDADTLLAARTDGNSLMHRFLNMSDGLVSSANKKLIFSTNLPSTRDIDPALLRPGRCFDVLEIRPLSRTEAREVVKEVGHGSLPDGKDSITLAEIFTNVAPTAPRAQQKVGFL